MTNKKRRRGEYRHRATFESLEGRELLAADLSLSLSVRENFIPGIPVLVHAALQDSNGTIDRDAWDGTVKLSSNGETVAAEPLRLVNGRGSTLITIEDAQPLSLEARLGDSYLAETQLTPVDASNLPTLSGDLTTDTTISGVVRITDDLTIPEQVTLTLSAGSLLLLEGVTSGEDGTQIEVYGELKSLGTASSPVTLTASNANKTWGEIDVQGGTASLENTIVTRAGSSPRGGHTSTGPAFRLRSDGTLSLTDSVVSDIRGKILQSSSGELHLTNTLLTRAVMGPEINNTGLEMRDSWIVDMAGRFHHNGKVDDNDGIYLHSQADNQTITLSDSVVAIVQDDAIDTLGSEVLIQNTIVRDADDKAISVFNGEVIVNDSLLVNSDIGIETKGSGSSTPDTRVNNTTIANVNRAIRARDKGSPDPNVVITYDITNSILHVNEGGVAVATDYAPEDLHINYSLLPQSWDHTGSGEGNINGAPLFVAPNLNDFHLQPNSPAIDAGMPDRVDDDGSRLDLGFYALGLAALPGDLNQDTKVDTHDIDRLCKGIKAQSQDSAFDLNDSGDIDLDDYDYLVRVILGTGPGDANLDGVFDSSDLVQVFQRGEYEDNQTANSGWSEGDWNCDGEFNSSDLVVAFQGGDYQVATSTRPEIRSSDLAAAIEADTHKQKSTGTA